MNIALILVGLAFPLLELAVLIKVGQWLGLGWTLLVLIATGIGGALIIQAQGLSAARRATQSMSEGRPPVEPVVDSFMLMIAGTLLVIPGFITDVMGLALLVPAIRLGIARWALSRLFAVADIRVETHEWRSSGASGPFERGAQADGRGPIIDAEFEKVDEPKPTPKPVSDDRSRGN